MPTKEELQKCIDNEIPQSKIKNMYGVSQGTVSSWFKKYNLKSKIKCGGAFNVKDLTGKTFGKLKVLKYEYTDDYGKNYLCECECGNKKIYRGSTLTSGAIIGCGCSVGKSNIGKKHDKYSLSHIGEIYNKLKIIDIEMNYQKNQQDYLMVCECDCGNITKQRYADLKNGKVKSCGCYNIEVASINGSTIGLNNYKNSYNWYFIKNGIKIFCRSGYEVIYANYLIQNDIAFEYEPKCFKLDNGKRYTPDFYLKNDDLYVEIKGSFKMNNSNQKTNIDIFKKTHKHKLMFWKDIVNECKLPYKAYSTIMNHADKNNIKREDFLAKGNYKEYDEESQIS